MDIATAAQLLTVAVVGYPVGRLIRVALIHLDKAAHVGRSDT